MISQTLLKNILETVRTKSEADLLQTEIAHLQERMYRSDTTDFKEGLNIHIPERIAGLFSVEEEKQISAGDRAALKKFLTEIKEALDLLPILRLDIAFEPSKEVRDTISDWVRKEVGGEILIDIGYDGTLAGGARVMYKGKYKEWTLSQIVDQALGKENPEILKALDRKYPPASSQEAETPL